MTEPEQRSSEEPSWLKPALIIAAAVAAVLDFLSQNYVVAGIWAAICVGWLWRRS
jgi:hypothetical protein